MRLVSFGMILVAAAAVYLSIHTLKMHGVEPASRDFWVCMTAPFLAGLIVMRAGVSGKYTGTHGRKNIMKLDAETLSDAKFEASSLLDVPEDQIQN